MRSFWTSRYNGLILALLCLLGLARLHSTYCRDQPVHDTEPQAPPTLSEAMGPAGLREPAPLRPPPPRPGSQQFDVSADNDDVYDSMGPLAAVEIEGNERRSTADITRLIKTHAGDKFDWEKIGKDVGALNETGWFAKVQHRLQESADGPVLVFSVKERPILEKVTFIGNRRFDDEFMAESKLQPGAGFNASENRKWAQLMEDLYHDTGYAHAKVVLEKGGSRDDHEVVMRFDEGPCVTVSGISFVGNEAVPGTILGLQMVTMPRVLGLSDGIYVRSRIYKDIAAIAHYYRNLGFSDVEVMPREHFSADQSRVQLEVQIDEGSRRETGNADALTRDIETAANGRASSAAAADPTRHATDEPAGLRDAEHVVVEGVRTFDVTAVRAALGANFDVAAAAQPAVPLETYLEAVASRINSGYRHAGFPDAAVAALHDASHNRIVVRVAEGQRTFCGEAEVVGTRLMSAEKLVRSLTDDPKPSSVLWKKGGPAPFDDVTTAAIRTRLEGTFHEAGFYDAHFEIARELEADGTTVRLKVIVNEEGVRSAVGTIVVTGAERDSTEDVLKYLDLRSGMPFDSDLPYRLHVRLWESGRYLSVQVEPGEISPPSVSGTPKEIDLRISLREYQDAPPLLRELDPGEQALLKLREWLKRWGEGQVDEDLVISGSLGPDLRFPLTHDWDDHGPPLQIRTVVAPGRGQTIGMGVKRGDRKQVLDVAIAADRERVIVADLQRQAKLVLANSAGPRLDLSLDGRWNREDRAGQPAGLPFRSSVHFSFSFVAAPAPAVIELKTKLSPAYLLSLVHDDAWHAAQADGIWEIKRKHFRLQFEGATGRLVEFHTTSDTDQDSLTIRSEKDALRSELQKLEPLFAAAAADYDSASSWKSAFRFAVDTWHAAVVRDGGGDAAEPLRALGKLLDRWSPPAVDSLLETFDDPPSGASDPFWIPTLGWSIDDLSVPGSVARKTLIGGGVLPILRQLVPKQSWWLEAGRDAALHWAADEPVVEPDWEDVPPSSRRGPFGQYLLTAIAEYVNLKGSEDLAKDALKNLSSLPLENDYGPILASDAWLAKWTISLANALRGLDDSELCALARLLPDTIPRVKIAESLLLLKADSDKPVEAVLPAALESLWSAVLHARVRQALIDLAHFPEGSVPEAIPDGLVIPAAAEEESEISSDSAFTPSLPANSNRSPPRSRGD